MVSRGQYFAIKAALTYTERELIDFYELQWHLRHHVPTVDEVVQYLNNKHVKEGKNSKVTATSVNYYLQRKLVIKGLDDRGIPWRQHSQNELTSTQVAAAVTVMNFADTRSNDDKLDQLGITTSQYFAWLNDPTFKNFVESLADQNLKNIRPAAITEFTKLVNKGDWQAIKYYLEVTGTVNSNEAPKSEVLLKMLVEIIQKHVKDPEVMLAIATDMQLAFANRTLEAVTSSPEITGSIVENDVEVANARKALGI